MYLRAPAVASPLPGPVRDGSEGAMLPTMSLTRSIAPSVLGLGLVACAALSPETRDTHRYVKELQPLLVENGHLASRVLSLAARVYNDQGAPDDLAATWTDEVVPLAEHLHQQAQFLQPPEPWAARHQELVDIWGDRAMAYRTLSEALVLADPDAWKKGRAEATEVKLREEEWFKGANLTLAPMGIQLDPMP